MNCKKYQSLQTKRNIDRAPPVLMLNACISTNEANHFWNSPGCLPEEIGIIISQGQFFCYQGEDLRLHLKRGAHNMTVYSLVGYAANIDIGHGKPHLVSTINGRVNVLSFRNVLISYSCSFCTNGTGRKFMVPL